MHWRSIVLGLACSALAVPAAADMKPFRVSLTGDGFDGKAWKTGVRIELDEGWKTYWRMPGESGIPPEFTWTSSAPARIAVSYPVPGRFEDASGETVGYKHEVVLPVTVEAGAASSLDLQLSLFFAVCKDVCIPAKAEASASLGPMIRDPDGVASVEQAAAAVPVPASFIAGAGLASEDGKPVLRLKLARKADDIFVETTTQAYFGRPRFSEDGLEASLPIANVTDGTTLKGASLKVTARTGGTGLEQTLVLP